MVIRLGIIGLSADQSAWANMAHVQAIKPGGPLTDLYKLAALATSNPESAKAAAEFHGVPADKAYSKPEDIANDPEVDLVVVSVKVRLLPLRDGALLNRKGTDAQTINLARFTCEERRLGGVAARRQSC